MKKGRILVVDDNQGIRAALKLLLPAYFEAVELIPSPNVLVHSLEVFRPDVVLLDMNFHADMNTGNEGLYWTRQIKGLRPFTEVVLFTAYADIGLAVEGMRSGAFDFIVKPWENSRLLSVLQSACSKALRGSRKRELEHIPVFWGSSPGMAAIRQGVAKAALTDATILITGENGTGKDVLASEIHRLSSRRDSPFIAVDAGAIPETLFESELFGHVKGAFTDAHSDHKGKFELADGGTLFLDEIGNIPLHLQAKLLRVLQNRSITRLGGTEACAIDIRLICATNMDLERLVAEGKFREDLYYRINTVRFHIPPLRERLQDIGPLAQIFISRFNEKYHRSVKSLSPEALEKLVNYSWHGNIRELQNCVEKAVIMADGEYLLPSDMDHSDRCPVTEGTDDTETLEMAEERIIRKTLEKYAGNMTLVAKALNISRPTLYKKLTKYNI